MNIRNLLRKRPYIGPAIGIVLILVACYLLWPARAATASDKAFFTLDDGKTYVSDNATLVAPCQIDGKTAVFAYIYRCPTCGRLFVGNMGRYKADRVEAIRNRLTVKPGLAPVGRPEKVAGPGLADLEMKRPGEPETAWNVPGASGDIAARMKAAAAGAYLIHCPDHTNVVAEPVAP